MLTRTQLPAGAAMVMGVVLVGAFAASSRGEDAPAPDRAPWPLALEDDFENGPARWHVVGGHWQIVDRPEGGHAYRVAGKSFYKPPVTSPLNIALVKDIRVADFTLTADVKSTAREYPHRDMCLIFGFQDPSHFYYVHFGRRADPHAHQIFIVNGQPRTKITEHGTAGTPWDDRWHKVRIVRRIADGMIEVYFDDLKKPIMTAHDKTFTWGQVGLGTFDDEGNWDNVKLRGTVLKQPR